MTERYEAVAEAIGFLSERQGEQPTLAEVAEHVGLSRFHLSRLFHRGAGVSPRRFLSVLTARHAEALLSDGQSVLDAALESGLSGPSRLHDLVTSIHAVTPGQLKAGGAELTIRWGFATSPFGQCLLATTERGVCALTFVTDGRRAAREDLAERWPEARLVEDASTARATAARVFDGALRRRGDGVELFVRGTNFQVRVWEALLAVPEGCVLSYGDLASALGRPTSARAVGNAVGANPVAWLIPCHRVLRASGAIGGYRWGLDIKRRMLGSEARDEGVRSGDGGRRRCARAAV